MIEGRWHPQNSAKTFDATLSWLDEEKFYLEIHGVEAYEGDIDTLEIAQRLGNIERRIVLKDGSLFITKDNDGVDKICKRKRKLHSVLHRLETRSSWVIFSLVLTVFFIFGFVKWGIPWSARQIANALPYETSRLISLHTMTLLDKTIFEESDLSMQRQDEIRKIFQERLVASSPHKEIVYTLHFRKWDDMPNAFALPSGDIVMTDKFVELAESQAQIDAVLFHEMGHVVHRHGLAMVIENTFISVVVMLIAGDSNGLADMGVGLGSFLVTSSYSRGHESEADIYAFDRMLELGIDPHAFTEIMEKITRYVEVDRDTKPSDLDRNQKSGTEETREDYLSTHPTTANRTKIAEAYSECFKKGLKRCEIEPER
jgi:Zn-dependent protease with chaperone function